MSRDVWCRQCGELISGHGKPCDAGVCVAKDCRQSQEPGNELGLCADHLAILAAQR